MEWPYLSTISSQQRETLRKGVLLAVCNDGAVFWGVFGFDFCAFSKKRFLRVRIAHFELVSLPILYPHVISGGSPRFCQNRSKIAAFAYFSSKNLALCVYSSYTFSGLAVSAASVGCACPCRPHRSPFFSVSEYFASIPRAQNLFLGARTFCVWVKASDAVKQGDSLTRCFCSLVRWCY